MGYFSDPSKWGTARDTADVVTNDTKYFKSASRELARLGEAAKELNREWVEWRDSPLRMFTSQSEIDRRYEKFSREFDELKQRGKDIEV